MLEGAGGIILDSEDKRVQFSFGNHLVIMGEMRVVVFSVFVFFFVGTPLYLLNALVMPELMSLQNTYSHADAIAQKVASGR